MSRNILEGPRAPQDRPFKFLQITKSNNVWRGDWLSAKGACCQAGEPDFRAQDPPHGREQTPQAVALHRPLPPEMQQEIFSSVRGKQREMDL